MIVIKLRGFIMIATVVNTHDTALRMNLSGNYIYMSYGLLITISKKGGNRARWRRYHGLSGWVYRYLCVKHALTEEACEDFASFIRQPTMVLRGIPPSVHYGKKLDDVSIKTTVSIYMRKIIPHFPPNTGYIYGEAFYGSLFDNKKTY